MKKILLMGAIGLCVFAFGQQTPKYVYAEIVGESRLLSNKVTIFIDYGQATSLFQSNKVKNEDGSNKVFNSMVDAMNYMGSMGWEFEQAYVVSGQQLVYHWLLKKDFSDLDVSIQEEMKKNFPTKRDLK